MLEALKLLEVTLADDEDQNFNVTVTIEANATKDNNQQPYKIKEKSTNRRIRQYNYSDGL